MSNEKVLSAKLEGYYGPYFPNSLEGIQKRFRYHPERFSDHLYDPVKEALGSGARVGHFPQTSDVRSRVCSPWSHSVLFMLEGTHYKLLFPNALDSDRVDGTYASRHVALYAREEIDATKAEAAAAFAAHRFGKAYRAQYANAIAHSKEKKK